MSVSPPPKEPNYTAWSYIDYKPAIKNLLPRLLVRHLPLPPKTILDVGCGIGGIARLLARRRYTCKGIDINHDAIATARRLAQTDRLSTSAQFENADLLRFDLSQRFDAILLIRLLTCLPRAEDRHAILDRTHKLLYPGGLVYIHDFARDAESEVYRPRYDRGRAMHWGEGNFAVYDRRKELLFSAHHHSREEIDHIIAPYEELSFVADGFSPGGDKHRKSGRETRRRAYKEHGSISMNGNPCRMFEFVGRKPLDAPA